VIRNRVGRQGTGNAFGSHLHLTLKLDGAQNARLSGGHHRSVAVFSDRHQSLQRTHRLHHEPLNLRSGPATSAQVLTILAQEAALTVLDNANTAKNKIGQANHGFK